MSILTNLHDLVSMGDPSKRETHTWWNREVVHHVDPDSVCAASGFVTQFELPNSCSWDLQVRFVETHQKIKRTTLHLWFSIENENQTSCVTCYTQLWSSSTLHYYHCPSQYSHRCCWPSQCIVVVDHCNTCVVVASHLNTLVIICWRLHID